MRSLIISYLLFSLLLLALVATGCIGPSVTPTVPAPSKPPLPPSTKSSPVMPTPQPPPAPQFSVLKLDAPGPALLPVNGLAGPVVGQSFAQQLAATGGMTPYIWTVAAGNLPPGLALFPGGLISGVPLNPGTFNFTLVLTDSQGTSTLGGSHTLYVASPPPKPTQQDTWNPGGPQAVVKPAFYISFPQMRYYKVSTSASWADLQRDQYLVIVPFVHGGKLPWKFTAVGLPKGLTCDPATGLIQGPLTESPDSLTISVILTDADGTQANSSPAGFSLRLGYRPPTPPPPAPAGSKGTLSVSCGNGVASISGYGDIGKGGGIVSLTAGSYVLTIRSPSTGKVLWQTNVRIDSGKTTVVKWDGYAE